MVPDITANLLIPLLIYIELMVLDWRMALATLGSIIIGMLAFAGMMHGYQPEYHRYVLASRRMNAAIEEYVHGIKEIKTFNQTADAFATYQTEIINFRDTTLRWWQRVWRYYSILLAVTPNTILFALPFGCWLFLTHQISMGVFVTSLLLGMALVGPLLQVVNYTDDFAMVDSAMKQVSALLTLPILKDQLVPVPLTWQAGIILERVSFSYQRTPALTDVSIHFKPNTITALVGESGSGKTTITRLLMRFFDSSQGRILIGNVPIDQLPLKQLLANISYVAQDNFLFNTSISDNIKMGNPEATPDQIEHAAALAGCSDFIAAQPQGFATVVGPNGCYLSGAQRQRLTLARAFLHQAPVLILDEATAALDSENELRIQAAIERLAKGKIVILIAHHLKLIRQVDQIVVMAHGKVVACGRHQQLLNESPVYQQLWRDYTNHQPVGGDNHD